MFSIMWFRPNGEHHDRFSPLISFRETHIIAYRIKKNVVKDLLCQVKFGLFFPLYNNYWKQKSGVLLSLPPFHVTNNWSARHLMLTTLSYLSRAGGNLNSVLCVFCEGMGWCGGRTGLDKVVRTISWDHLVSVFSVFCEVKRYLFSAICVFLLLNLNVGSCRILSGCRRKSGWKDADKKATKTLLKLSRSWWYFISVLIKRTLLTMF